MKKPSEYAVYRGDDLLFVGTADEIAKEFDVKRNTALFWSTPSYKKRVEKREKHDKAIYSIRIEEDE